MPSAVPDLSSYTRFSCSSQRDLDILTQDLKNLTTSSTDWCLPVCVLFCEEGLLYEFSHEFSKLTMGKISASDKMRIPTLHKRGLGYRRIVSKFPDNQWNLQSVKNIC